MKPAAAKKVEVAPTRPPLVGEEPEESPVHLEQHEEGAAVLGSESAPRPERVLPTDELPRQDSTTEPETHDYDFPDDGFEPLPAASPASPDKPSAAVEPSDELIDFDFD